jgi:hypothetical protein
MKLNRRTFLKASGMAVAALPFARGLLLPQEAQATGLPEAKETDAMAKSLKYCPNADKPSKNCPDRKKPEKKDQYCHNCQLYTKLSGAGKDELGKCLLLPKNSVRGAGWCISWVKRPG